jgi:protein O-GlcNAc transferase
MRQLTDTELFQQAFQLEALGRFNEATALYQLILQSIPEQPGALYKLGEASLREGQAEAAAALFQRALLAAKQQGLDSEIIQQALTQAQAKQTELSVSAASLVAFGIALQDSKEEDKALAHFRQALQREPDYVPALARLVHVLLGRCEWGSELSTAESKLLALLKTGDAALSLPLHLATHLPLNMTELISVTQRVAQLNPPTVTPLPAPKPFQTGRRVRLGYLSNDIKAHPTAYLLASFFAQHDKHRFEVFFYDHSLPDDSAARAQIKASCEHWRDVTHWSDAQVAEQIRKDDIDCLIDLKGHTHGARTAILAYRPARLQWHYMGYPGPLALPGVDGYVGDAVAAPFDDAARWPEQMLRLPRCYLATDNQRGLVPAPSRASLGLPEHAIVLACFNNSLKLRPELASIWCEALRREPRAVLWLYAARADVPANLRAFAASQGIDPKRFIFAEFAEQAEHISRLQAADLCLDTLPYGSHTTGVDALWAGVPLLTCYGETYAGRVGASLMTSAKLPQYITYSPDDYAAKLFELVAKPEVLHETKAWLQANKLRLPLFDTAGFVQDFEALILANLPKQA